MRMKSDARVRKHANVDANAIAPRAARPIAVPTMTCSAMKFWKNRSGNAFSKRSLNVEFLTSASSETTRESTAPSAASAVPHASRVATCSPGLYDGAAIFDRSGAGELRDLDAGAGIDTFSAPPVAG